MHPYSLYNKLYDESMCLYVWQIKTHSLTWPAMRCAHVCVCLPLDVCVPLDMAGLRDEQRQTYLTFTLHASIDGSHWLRLGHSRNALWVHPFCRLRGLRQKLRNVPLFGLQTDPSANQIVSCKYTVQWNRLKSGKDMDASKKAPSVDGRM
jgi:hypothetical protein